MYRTQLDDSQLGAGEDRLPVLPSSRVALKAVRELAAATRMAALRKVRGIRKLEKRWAGDWVNGV